MSTSNDGFAPFETADENGHLGCVPFGPVRLRQQVVNDVEVHPAIGAEMTLGYCNHRGIGIDTIEPRRRIHT